MQNFKIFLTAFVTGIIVFGILAVLLIHFGFRTMSGDHEFDFGTGDDTGITDTYAQDQNALSSDEANTVTRSALYDNGGTAENSETDLAQNAD